MHIVGLQQGNEKNITITCSHDATGLLQAVSIIRKQSVQLTAN